MEALGDILLPYKEPIGLLTRIVTMSHMFSGVFVCYKFYKQGSTQGTAIMPFLGGVIMSILNLKFGFILRDDTMIQVNSFGLALNILYLMIYFKYSSEKSKVWLQTGIATAFSAMVIAYSKWEDPKLIQNRFGTIITAFVFFLIASPLFHLKRILKNKSTEGMPFPIIFSGTIVTFMWLLYGIIIKNKFLVLQNTVAVSLCAFQLALFVIYPSKPKGKEKAKAKAKKTN